METRIDEPKPNTNIRINEEIYYNLKKNKSD